MMPYAVLSGMKVLLPAPDRQHGKDGVGGGLSGWVKTHHSRGFYLDRISSVSSLWAHYGMGSKRAGAARVVVSTRMTCQDLIG